MRAGVRGHKSAARTLGFRLTNRGSGFCAGNVFSVFPPCEQAIPARAPRVLH